MFRTFVLVFLLAPPILCAQSPISIYKINPSQPGRPIATQPAQVMAPGKLNIVTFSMNFSACPPCVNEINAVSRRLKVLQQDTSIVYSVITSVRKEAPSIISVFSLPYLDDNQWKFPVYIDTNYTLSRASGFSSFPMTFLVDRDGKPLYASDLAKDTVVELRTTKLFAKILEKLQLPEMISIGNRPLAVQDIERLTYSSAAFFEKTMQWNELTKTSKFYKKVTNTGEVMLFENNTFGEYFNRWHIYLTDPKMMEQYIQAFKEAGYTGDLGLSIYDSVTNYKAYRRKIFSLETYESKTKDGQTLYNIQIASLNLGSIKDFNEHTRVEKLSRLTVSELEMLAGYPSGRAAIYVIAKGFTPHEYSRNKYSLTTNGIDGYNIELDGEVSYSSKDKTFSDQLRSELLKAGYQLRKNKEVFKNEADHFEYTKGKLEALFFKLDYDGSYVLLMRKM